MKSKINFILFMFLLIMPLNVFSYSDYLIASGENIGIKLKSKGIIILDTYDNINPKLKKGDIIVSINDNDDIDINTFTSIISKNYRNKLSIGYVRNGKIRYTTLNVKNNKTGLYLKDSIIGIGTLTFIDPNSKVFGALGHEIIESSTGDIFKISNGNIFDSTITSIDNSENGIPGEKNATIDDISIGNIKSNTNKGIFGNYFNLPNSDKLYKVASKNDIKTSSL